MSQQGAALPIITGHMVSYVFVCARLCFLQVNN